MGSKREQAVIFKYLDLGYDDALGWVLDLDWGSG